MLGWAPWLLLISAFVAPALVWFNRRAAAFGVIVLLIAGAASFWLYWTLDIPEENVAEGFGQGLGILLSFGGTLFGLMLVGLSALIKHFAAKRQALEKQPSEGQLRR